MNRGLLACSIVAVICALVLLSKFYGGDVEEYKLAHLKPGGQLSVRWGEHELEISIPEGEGMSVGTFGIRDLRQEYQSGPVSRDGALESLWVADVTGDGRDDLVVVIRSVGSGSYAQVVLFEAQAEGYVGQVLPDISSKLVPGYMGHDSVSVRSRRVFKSFPTYHRSTGVRVNQQWGVDEAIQGISPVTKGPDSNASLSGETVWVFYDFESGEWRR